MTRKLLATDEQADLKIEFNLDAIVRADLSTRAEADAKLVQGGIITPNEARAHHNLPRAESGDVPLSPLNMTPAATRTAPCRTVRKRLITLNMTPAATRTAPPAPPAAPAPLPDPRVAALVRSIAQGIATKEMKAAQHAARKPKTFRAWADSFFADHVAHLQDRLPIIDAAQAQALAHEARDTFVREYEAGKLDETLSGWAEARAASIASTAAITTIAAIAA